MFRIVDYLSTLCQIVWLIFHPQSNAPSCCDIRGQKGGGGAEGYMFDQRYMPGLTRPLRDPNLKYPLKISNDLLELGFIWDGLHFEDISVFVFPYK